MNAEETSAAGIAGADIVKMSRVARFAGITNEQWRDRLTALITHRTDRGVRVSDLQPVATAAGGSNGTLLFKLQFDDEPARRQHVLRFLPTEGLFHRYDVAGQFALQKALEDTPVPVPKQLWLDETGEFLGRPGYVMDHVPGISPPMAWMTSGVIVDADPASRRQMTLGYVEKLADIHAVDWAGLGLSWLQNRAAGTKPVERETNWYWDALVWAQNDKYIQQLAPIRDWLIANEPTDVDTVLCHGDANLGNYLFDGNRVSAVVDWEMSFLGPPECDICFTEVGDPILHEGIPRPDGCLTNDEMYAEYERLSGRKLRHLEYFRVFTAFRLAVINVLAMRHFPPDALEALMPVLERGPKICLEYGQKVGV